MCGQTVELMLNRIDTLGMSHQHFNADLLETEDLIALMDIRDQFDEVDYKVFINANNISF